jgi:hypothetical protein
LIEPAGEMWSVVTESPRMARTLAAVMAPLGPAGVIENSSKKGGSAM